MTLLEDANGLDAYEALAPHYDLLTAAYDYDRWVTELLRVARRHSLRGHRALDLACGTGHAIRPLQRHGFDVTACDLSPAMVEVAGERAPDVRPFVADMRFLPAIGPFDLVLCLDDAVNYLLDEDGLAAAMTSATAVMATDALLIFDVNTRTTYTGAFARDRITSDEERTILWRGHGLEPGDGRLARATVEVFARTDEGGLWRQIVSEHCQRVWQHEELTRALDAAGLQVIQTLGQRTGAILELHPDAGRHTKVVYVARRAPSLSSSIREEVGA
jgi:SAM-dependent methyltransferase